MAKDIGRASKKLSEHQEIAAMANEFAIDEPEFGSDQDNSLFMVRAAFDAYEGPMVTEKYLKIELVLNGSGRFYNHTQFGASEAQFQSGSVFAAPPGVIGETRSSPMDMLGFLIDPDQFDCAESLRHAHDSLHSVSNTSLDDPGIRATMLSLWHNSRSSSRSSFFIREGIAVMLDQLIQHANGTQVQSELRKVRDDQLLRARAFILANLENEIGVQDIALAAGTTYHQFFSVCRQTTGMTPFAFLTYCRMAHAKGLMRDGANVVQAGLAVGYSNPSKFAAAFRRHFGVAPSRWKQR